MFKTIRVLFIATFTVLFIASCSSPAAGITPVPSLTNTPLAPTITPTNNNCYPSAVLLPVSDAQGVGEDEIVGKLMDLWLSYLQAPEAPDWCRIDGYKIDKVYYDEQTPYLPIEPKGDFIRQVLYSIKVSQLSDFWVSLGAEADQQYWYHTGANVAIFRYNNYYTMKFAYP
jgi:hypothetical protein